MKRDYIALWCILAAAFLVFIVLSLCGDISIGNWHLKTVSIWDDAPIEADSTSAPVDTVKEETNPKAQIVLDQSPKTILIIGDSMLEGLFPRLAAYCAASDYKLYSVIWYSSTTELYGETKLLTDYINIYHPDYVFLSLGGNELFITDVAEKRDKSVKAILAELGDIPYLWIGPPNWKPDTGINDLIRSNVPQGCFFTSNGMHFDRKRDGAHPTSKSASLWMDSIIRWMPDHSKYFLPFNTPEQPKGRATRLFIHQPGELTERPK